MKKNCLKIFIFVFCVLMIFVSCGNNPEKKVKKMFAKYNEGECKSIVASIADELGKESYYKWNGKKCALSVEGELGNKLNQLIEFHRNTHLFKNKEGVFNTKEWEDWIYFYRNPYDTEDADALRTDCFICWEKIDKEDFKAFEESFDKSKEELIYNSFFGSSVKKVEDELTEKYKKKQKQLEAELAEKNRKKQKIEWMTKCSVQLTDYVFGSVKTVNQIFSGFPNIVKVEKEENGNNLIMKAFIEAKGEKIINLESVFQCVKASNSCYCMETKFTYSGESASSKVWGNVYSDPEGAGECLSLLCNGIEVLKVFKN